MRRRLRQKSFRFNKSKTIHNRVPVLGKAELWNPICAFKGLFVKKYL